MTKAELNWIAGFYEGEGSVGCYGDTVIRASGNRTCRWSLRLTLAQNGKHILNWVKRKVGYGSVCRFNRGTNVCAWQTSATNAARFLIMVLPSMRIPYKRNQAIAALRKYFRKVNSVASPEKAALKEKFYALYQTR